MLLISFFIFSNAMAESGLHSRRISQTILFEQILEDLALRLQTIDEENTEFLREAETNVRKDVLKSIDKAKSTMEEDQKEKFKQQMDVLSCLSQGFKSLADDDSPSHHTQDVPTDCFKDDVTMVTMEKCTDEFMKFILIELNHKYGTNSMRDDAMRSHRETDVEPPSRLVGHSPPFRVMTPVGRGRKSIFEPYSVYITS